jgi:hypothetical protein
VPQLSILCCCASFMGHPNSSCCRMLHRHVVVGMYPEMYHTTSCNAGVHLSMTQTTWASQVLPMFVADSLLCQIGTAPMIAARRPLIRGQHTTVYICHARLRRLHRRRNR